MQLLQTPIPLLTFPRLGYARGREPVERLEGEGKGEGGGPIHIW
jgi:hypothetical protein